MPKFDLTNKAYSMLFPCFIMYSQKQFNVMKPNNKLNKNTNMSHSNKVVCIMNESNFNRNNRRSASSIHVDCGRVLGTTRTIGIN